MTPVLQTEGLGNVLRRVRRLGTSRLGYRQQLAYHAPTRFCRRLA